MEEERLIIDSMKGLTYVIRISGGEERQNRAETYLKKQ